MYDTSDALSEEERSLFRPFTRESLTEIEARIAEEHAKQKELEKKRAEGEVFIEIKKVSMRIDFLLLNKFYLCMSFLYIYLSLFLSL